MPLGLYPGETRDLLSVDPGQPGTTAPYVPGVMEGLTPQFSFLPTSPTPIIPPLQQGIQQGLESIRQTALTAVSQAGSSALRTFQGLPGFQSDFARPPTAGAAMLTELKPDEIEQQRARDSKTAIDSFASDPHVVGTAGQILHDMTAGLTVYSAGSAIGGPVTGAALVGATTGTTTRENLIANGVDETTADHLAIGSALFSSFGSVAPGGYGKTLLQRIGTGSLAQSYTGVANRGLMSKVLADNGYDAMAKNYQAFDGQAIMADAVLGAAFGAVHHVFAPSAVDAAHTSADAAHVERDLAPGVPITPDARQAHYDNMVAGADALLNDKPLETQPVETIPNPAQDALRTKNESELASAIAEHTGEPVAAQEPFTERRTDALELARLKELGGKGLRNLTPDETAEYAGLLQKDRLAAKVAGRRLNGVQNMDAYAQALEEGTLQPAQGFADMDMLKSLNDTMGHHAGDEAIRTMGETLAHYFGVGNVFHRGGDEFVTQAASPEAHAANMEAARRYLANHKVQAFDENGNLISEKIGLGFSHGTGRTAELAEQAAYADKAARQRAGLRSDRGTVAAEPAGERGEPESDQAAGAETGTGSPETDELLTQARDAMERNPSLGDLEITHPETGESFTAADAIKATLDDLKTAQGDGELAKVAAACFGRA